MISTRLLANFFVVACLAGCDAGSQFVDLQAYMDEVRARPKGSIEPLPNFSLMKLLRTTLAACAVLSRSQ